MAEINSVAVLVFSDVHADAEALSRVLALREEPAFTRLFGRVDTVVNLGDLLGRGYAPVETLRLVERLAGDVTLVSLLGNHDHACIHGISVSGSDARSEAAHRRLNGSPHLDALSRLPVEAVLDATLFVHGGPLRLGDVLTEQPFWQRLSRVPGPSYAGYHYTPQMAFAELERRGLSHLCCGHQHVPLCCQKKDGRIVSVPLKPETLSGLPVAGARIDLSVPTITRLGACTGENPEFAVTDFLRFWYLRLE
ncbi:metallophosphoesterase family protein [Methanofollis ethanolicus]|uniref:metallophosphoesterase family protein n=1 Tax=Methanofollis ethanolicus TaxID=488124 RepID=UPI001F448345|nr:metallophosphoesterase [Methanofollis ethanolicus]